ncbi:Hsp20/alpha crystallin family protein [Desulfobacterium sp. N47]
MEITKWNPWREIEDMFERYTKSLGHPSGEFITPGDWAPRVDIAETDTEFIIKAEIPEISKDDVKVTIDNGILTIKGERKKEKEEKGKKYHRIERYYGNFIRSFTLPDNVDESNIKASFKDGMLSLNIKKTKESKPKLIEVKLE